MSLITDLGAVGAGGCIGSIARYLISIAMRGCACFPWATLIVNIVGCLLIGIFYGIASNGSMSRHLTLLLTAGLCGGFTTFSTFSKESLDLLQAGNIWAFVAYIAASVILGIAAVALGIYLTTRA